jgi:hypothetical protein
MKIIQNKSSLVMMIEEYTFIGTAEELEALGSMFIQKAKHPDNVFINYTGVKGIIINAECITEGV